MSEYEAEVTLATPDGTVVKTTLPEMQEAVDTIRQSLRIKGIYRGMAHKAVYNQMWYAVKLRVEHELDRKQVLETITAGMCLVTYRVPAVSNHTVQAVGMIDSARPDDGEGIWLKGADPGYVTFTINHVASSSDAEMTALLTMLQAPELEVEARFVPRQQRLL